MQFLYSLVAILNEMSPYILLGFLLAGLLHAFVKPSLMTRHLSGNGIKPVLKAAMVGVPLPLCSCGVLPTAVSLRRNGASRASATSFLIATPQTGVDSIAATWSLLEPAMAVVRPVAALSCALLGGTAVGLIDRDEESQEMASDGDRVDCGCSVQGDDGGSETGFLARMGQALKYGFVDMIQHVGKWLVLGLVIASVITVVVPDNLFLGLSRYPLLAMLVMVAVAVPMYICATGSIPIALSLMIKGLTPGVAFVLLMAGPAANFASVMILKRSLGARATAIYIGSVVLSAIAFGLAIDYLLPRDWFIPSGGLHGACCGEARFGIFDTVCSAALVAMLVYALIIKPHNHKTEIIDTNMKRTYKVTGMMCPHCQANVKKGLESLDGVDEVVVDLGKSIAEVAGTASPEAVVARIRSLGYEASEA